MSITICCCNHNHFRKSNCPGVHININYPKTQCHYIISLLQNILSILNQWQVNWCRKLVISFFFYFFFSPWRQHRPPLKPITIHPLLSLPASASQWEVQHMFWLLVKDAIWVNIKTWTRNHHGPQQRNTLVTVKSFITVFPVFVPPSNFLLLPLALISCPFPCKTALVVQVWWEES